MSLNPRLSYEGADVATDAVCALLDDGYLRIYDGSQPAHADVPVASQTVLVELRFGTPAYAGSEMGVAQVNPIAPVEATAAGVASWFRAYSQGGVGIFDGSVGVSNANLVLDSIAISEGMEITIAGLNYTQGRST